MTTGGKAGPYFQISIAVEIEDARVRGVFVFIYEDMHFGTSSLGELLATQKSGRSTRASIVEVSSSHEPIHGITAHSRVSLAVVQFGQRTIGRTFEDSVSFHIRAERAFALADDEINVLSIGHSITHVAPSPSGKPSSVRTSVIGRVVWHQPV